MPFSEQLREEYPVFIQLEAGKLERDREYAALIQN
jgi:hypothetical protein